MRKNESKYQSYLLEPWVKEITRRYFTKLMTKLNDYDLVIDYLRRKRSEEDNNSRVLMAKLTIKNKYNEYKKLTPYSPCSYVTFWNYYTIERQSFEEIVNTKFSKWWPRTLWLWEITNAFNKAKEKWYASVYSTYYKRLKNNTLELKRR